MWKLNTSLPYNPALLIFAICPRLMKTNPTQRPVSKHSEQLNSQSPKTINNTNVLLLVSGKMNLKYIPTQMSAMKGNALLTVQKHRRMSSQYTNWKKPDAETTTCMISFAWLSGKVKSIEIEIRIMAARGDGWVGIDYKEPWGHFLGPMDCSILCGSGYRTANVCRNS